MSYDSNPPAGWYPDPELPGGERYWDGFAWSEARRAPPPGTPIPPPPPPMGASTPPIGQPMAASRYEASQAGWALGLSVVGFCCFLLSIAGLVLGIIELNAINAGRRDPSNKGLAIAAIIIGGLLIAFGIGSLALNFSVYSDIGS